MKTNSPVSLVAFAVIALGRLAAMAQEAAATVLPPSELVGTWRGTTEIFGPFTVGTFPSTVADDHQRVVVEIAASGAVTGQIGEAVFLRSSVRRNRGAIGRTLNVATDYIVRGVLEGKVTPHDPGARRDFTIPFNLIEGKLVGTMMVLPKRPLTRRFRLEKTGTEHPPAK